MPFAPRRYVAYRAPSRVRVDGKLDDPAWAGAPWSEPFVDIEGDRGPRPRFRTRTKLLRDDTYLTRGVACAMVTRNVAAWLPLLQWTTEEEA